MQHFLAQCLRNSRRFLLYSGIVLPPFGDQINPIIEDCLPCAIFEFLESSSKLGKENSLDVIASLLKHGIWPTPRQLSLIGSNAGFESSKKCLLDAISLATNPVLVGMTLSLQLSGSAGLGNEAHRQTASRLQNAVEELLLEIFERLPQTVDGFEEVEPIRGGMKASLFYCRRVLDG